MQFNIKKRLYDLSQEITRVLWLEEIASEATLNFKVRNSNKHFSLTEKSNFLKLKKKEEKFKNLRISLTRKHQSLLNQYKYAKRNKLFLLNTTKQKLLK